LCDEDGWSPLISACHCGNTQIVELLLCYDRNIDINIKTTTEYYGVESGSIALDTARKEKKKSNCGDT